MRHLSMRALLMGTSAVALFGVSSMPVLAADTSASNGSSEVTAVIVTGTRQSGVKAVDSPAPIQVVGADALKRTGSTSLNDALSTGLPSFNAQSYGQDTAELTLSAALRGLSPNDTLVLVNGKRRHTTANLSVDGGSPYSGSATTDLSLIPVGAIDHIEVLQDGAAAQYGTDAVAGVVNIILKKSPSAGSLSLTGGQYYLGDGKQAAISFNKGFALGDKGFVNVTLENRYHDFSQRGGADRRFYNPDGTLNSSLANPTDPVSTVNGAGVPQAKNAPNVNPIYGDPRFNLFNGFLNTGYELNNNVSLYGNASYSNRVAEGNENYRKPSKVYGCTSPDGVTPGSADGLYDGGCANANSTPVFPFTKGFIPQEQTREEDYSLTAGIKGDYAGWDWDLATTFGKDQIHLYNLHSANEEVVNNAFAGAQALAILNGTALPTTIDPGGLQRDFFAGAFATTQWTSSFDVNRNFDLGLASPINLALGVETRRDTYRIGAGEPNSYAGFGSEAFSGLAPFNAGGHSRTNTGVYIDVAGDPIKNLHLDIAGRHEHYSDFGDADVGKLTARYDFNSAIAVRGTLSNGFRAPTLAEEYYSGINVSPNYNQVQLPPNDPAAVIAGFQNLKPEKSDNLSLGLVFHPVPKLQIALDAYQITIRNRIVDTGMIIGQQPANGQSEYVYSQSVLNAIKAHGITVDPSITYTGIETFTNGVNTRTQGVELTTAYTTDFDQWGRVDWSLGLNYNNTRVTKVKALIPGVAAIDPATGVYQTVVPNPNVRSVLSKSTPPEKLILGANYNLGKWSINLRDTIYGPVSQVVSASGTGYGPGTTNVRMDTTSITDLDIGYKVLDNVRVNVGANNLFDLRPKSVANYGPVSDGNNVYGEPIQWSPFNINGGYYYGKITYNF